MILQKSIGFDTQETFLIIIDVENSRAASYFCRNYKYIYIFSGFFDEQKVSFAIEITLYISLL